MKHTIMEKTTGFKHLLEKTLYRELYRLNEDSVNEKSYDDIIIELSTAAMGFGGKDSLESEGVILIEFDNKQGLSHYADYLDNCEYVDDFEILASHTNVHLDKDEPVDELDLVSIRDDAQYKFFIIIYIWPQFVDYISEEPEEQDEEQDEDEESEVLESVEQVDEVIKKIRVNAAGVRSIKMACGKGFKWNPVAKICVQMSGQVLATLRMAIRKALITKRGEGVALSMRVKRKRARAMVMRKRMGLK